MNSDFCDIGGGGADIASFRAGSGHTWRVYNHKGKWQLWWSAAVDYFMFRFDSRDLRVLVAVALSGIAGSSLVASARGQEQPPDIVPSADQTSKPPSGAPPQNGYGKEGKKNK